MISSLSSVAIALAIAQIASATAAVPRDVLVDDMEVREPEPEPLYNGRNNPLTFNVKPVEWIQWHTKTVNAPVATITKTLEVGKHLCKVKDTNPTKTVTKIIRPTFTKTVMIVQKKKKNSKFGKKHRKHRKNRKHGKSRKYGKKHRKHRKSHYYGRSPEPEPAPAGDYELNNLD